ncbi:prepilin-type N-terminal cleavage/methylation domain-containing protein [Desulfosporosinus orientis DSM 765]|uniref:Prepilin-type N-terminal cleavage/methylation domain-containing protein n=1 Tax=Desulfosporosinus orientis (strain ATCC 19365 / DSM 765 / NCIMB 8382 / VKM B-1628 / Singapore I) TaxID=768706 RepID=G7W835_DESOD|nr:prepilin-type N-terminal cleavage/methylation domain-containing protein [Desulfosporosinus orientis DSM 765]
MGCTLGTGNNQNHYAGFTLWEILVVLFLMGILLMSFTPHFGSASSLVRKQMDQANIRRIEGAVQLYKIDVGTFPLSVEDLVNSPDGVRGWHGPYIKEIPHSPYNTEQDYQINSSGRVTHASPGQEE